MWSKFILLDRGMGYFAATGVSALITGVLAALRQSVGDPTWSSAFSDITSSSSMMNSLLSR